MALFGGKNKISVQTDNDRITRLLSRNIEDVFVKEHLAAQLLSGRRLRVKLGFDPTGPNVHIGRAITLWKLKEFQDLGHQVVFIVGDFTARIGDPSDKLSKRPMLSEKDIQNNLKTYKKQIGNIIDLSKAEFHFNSSWLSKLSLADLIGLAESFSIQQMSNRRNFKERLERGDEVSLREFLYPLLQGYDSVAVKADVEIGGFDQLFNLKAGRIVQRHFSVGEQDVLTTRMLLGTDGRKMSTSWGNVINIADEPADMFGKVMSLKDELIPEYTELCTEASIEEVERVKQDLANAAVNPKDLKVDLARRIVSRYWGDDKADAAARGFDKVFSSGEVPESIPVMIADLTTPLVDIALKAGVVASKSEWHRLVEGGGVAFVEGEKITDPKVQVTRDGDLKIGKRRFLRIRASSR